MRLRLQQFWREWVTLPRLFALFCGIAFLLAFFGGSPGLPGVVAAMLGAVLLVRVARGLTRQTIWRLRHRLVVTYLFIAVVPVVLILVLVGLGAYFVAGQVAVYLVQSELDRRVATLAGPAQFLLHAPAAAFDGFSHNIEPMLNGRFPSLQLLATGERRFQYPEGQALTAPPPGWGDYSGIVVKDGAYYGLAHVKASRSEITVLAPLTLDLLSDLIPNLGDVRVLDLNRHDDPRPAQPRAARVPPPVSRFDYAFTWMAPLTIANWAKPGENETHLMTITTRASAVLGTVFGQKLEVEQVVLVLFVAVLVLFSIVEIIALVIGVSLTRSITGAVENLYQGTLRISEGDVAHRIRVNGSDQLAALGASFNSMSQNLERLIVVEKEKERLQSEIEIAREVQNQLFPRAAPMLRNLELSGVCHPARMVSGDYYDYLCVQDSALAFAIGDVAGKGISAALLMASIQSIMRTQLSTGVQAAAAVSVGGPVVRQLHAAPLVAQLNKQLYENTAPEKYATFFFGIYEERLSTLTYTNAGHLPPVLLRGDEAILLNPTGTVVGAFPRCVYEEETIELKSGDILVAYTDGITEPENAYGEEFGLERVLDLVRRHREQPSTQIIDHIMHAVEQWTGAAERPDDMTVLLARRVG